MKKTYATITCLDFVVRFRSMTQGYTNAKRDAGLVRKVLDEFDLSVTQMLGLLLVYKTQPHVTLDIPRFIEWVRFVHDEWGGFDGIELDYEFAFWLSGEKRRSYEYMVYRDFAHNDMGCANTNYQRKMRVAVDSIRLFCQQQFDRTVR